MQPLGMGRRNKSLLLATGQVTQYNSELDIGAYYWDVQIIRTVGVPISTLVAGMFVVSSDITRAVA